MTEPNISGHTPGPWAVNCSHIYAPDGAIIAQVHNPGSKASDYPLVANRDLMAAAPDLLEACRKALNYIENTEGEIGIILDSGDMLRAAIAKATGQ